MLTSSSTTRIRASGMALGETQGELGAQSAFAADRDLAAVLLDDAMHEGEAETGDVVAGREERLERVREVLGGDAVARVGDRDLDHTGSALGLHSQLAPGGHGAQRSDAQGPHDLAEPLAIRVEQQRR